MTASEIIDSWPEWKRRIAREIQAEYLKTTKAPQKEKVETMTRCKHNEDPVDCLGCSKDRYEAYVQAAFKGKAMSKTPEPLDLLPCPFCGVDPDSRISSDGESWKIACEESECGFASVFAHDEEEAIAQWQTRRPLELPTDASPPEIPDNSPGEARAPLPPPLVWSTAKPTQPGWYWTRFPSKGSPWVDRVRETGVGLQIDSGPLLRQVRPDREWAGPIPSPTEGPTV